MKPRANKEYILCHLIVGQLQTNCYIFGSANTREVAVIDPGADYDKIRQVINKEKLLPRFIINTHGHIDHVGADKDLGLPVYIHRCDAGFLSDPAMNLSALYGNNPVPIKASRLLQDQDIIKISDIELKVIHTPGHTPGGISLYYDGLVFTGDTLFDGGIGRTDLPLGDHKKLIDSIKDKLMVLDEKVLVYPGHGAETTIGKEKNTNPWL